MSVIFAICAGCGRNQAEPGSAPEQEKVIMKFTAQQIIDNPDIINEKLRADNIGYRGGAQFAINPEFGLVGMINISTVTNISALQGVPFAALDFRGLPVSDISPLRGMPLVMLGLENTRVVDLSPLHGSKLKKLYLNNTQVADLTPLEGLPLEELMLVDIKISSIGPLKGMPLQMLWLNNTRVSDISPLAGNTTLMSLTLEGTQVRDLSPLAGCKSLKRLHIGNTPVTDLSPVQGFELQRLIFNPLKISKGMDIVHGMSSLQELGTTLNGRMSPAQFWNVNSQGSGSQ
jgi:Leucine-rich repeat (LRR) protein